MDVPLAMPKPPPVTDDVIDSPGAKRDIRDDTLENDETTSDFVVEPTLIAEDTHPGADMLFVLPPLPAAIAVAMPTERRLSMIAFVGSESHDVVYNVLPPRLRLAAA